MAGTFTQSVHTVTIAMELQSVTVRDDAMADKLYSRTITDNDDGTVLVRDVVRVTEPVYIAYDEIEAAVSAAKAKTATKETADVK